MNKSIEIELSALYPISIDRLFELLSRADYIKQWLSPNENITITVLEYDFCIGGVYRIIYNMPDGSHNELQGQFLDIEKPNFIQFTWLWQKPDIHADILSTVIWRLQEYDKQTKLTVLHQVKNDNYLQRHQTGWQGTFIMLLQLIEKIK